jgi:phage terminase large subunit
MKVEFPQKLGFLLTEKRRYKGAKGGRGSAKSWSFARALLILGSTRKLRILCTREVQKSIKQSVHKLLKDQIEGLGLGSFYQVLENEIRGKNGSEFSFSGLSDQTVDSIKSFEGCDIVWVEEAQSVSKRSWSVLIPTIRKEGSEIWISFNPELETDETYDRFITNQPEDCIIVDMNYSDNRWFPAVLEKERLHALATLPKAEYENIWEGKCMPAVAGAIYYEQVAKAEEEGRICNVPYDPLLKVQVVFDLGWNDAMSISLVQKSLSSVAVIENIEQSHKTLDYYSALLRERKYRWGKVWLPHDGRHKNYQTGKSAEDVMKALGWDVAITPNMSIEDGIRLTRMNFGKFYFDKTKAARIVQCAKRYRRSINQQTQEPGAPLHDEWSHGADNLRYIAVNAEKFTNDDWGNLPPLQTNSPDDSGLYF